MPCSDGGWSRDIEKQNAINLLKSENIDTVKQFDKIISLQTRNDKLAKMLCIIMKLCDKESQPYLFDEVEGLKEWWEEHKKFDRMEGR